MAEPLVSIIVNNYNYGRYLAAAIDSALTQDHRDVEVVVVDDGSTDDSERVITRYGDRITALFKGNGGQGSAFNAGFAACRGAIVNFLDSDDRLHPDAARRAAEAFTADPRLSHWLAPLELIDADGHPTGSVTPARPLPSGDLRDRVLSFGPWAYAAVPTSGNFWSRAYLERVLPMPEAAFRLGADEYLANLAALYGRIANSETPVAFYRAHGANHYWRPVLGVGDVAEDHGNFLRVAGLLTDHAERLGLPVTPNHWVKRDWRQQLRRLILRNSGYRVPTAGVRAVLAAILSDQTAAAKKAALVPVLASLAVLPKRSAVALGLRLLARR